MEDVVTVRCAVGAQIRAYRKRNRWTGKRLAARIGKTEASLSRIERGKQNISLNDLVTLANVFEVPLVVSLGALAPQEPQAHAAQVGQAVVMVYRELGRQLEQLLIIAGAVGKDTEVYSLLVNRYAPIPAAEYASLSCTAGGVFVFAEAMC